jgi:hypothetical protein
MDNLFPRPFLVEPMPFMKSRVRACAGCAPRNDAWIQRS